MTEKKGHLARSFGLEEGLKMTKIGDFLGFLDPSEGCTEPHLPQKAKKPGEPFLVRG